MGIVLKGNNRNIKQEVLKEIRGMMENDYASIILEIDSHLFLLHNFEVGQEAYYAITLVNLENLETVHSVITHESQEDEISVLEDDFLEYIAENYNMIKIIEKDIEITL